MSTASAPQALAGHDVFVRISGHLAGETEIPSALAAVADEIASLIPFTHADICLNDSPGWTVSYEVGITTSWSRKRTRVQNSPVRDLLTARCDAMLTEDATQDPRYTFAGARCEPIFRHDLRSRVNVPLKIMGRVIGTLNISHNARGLYDAATVTRARHLADMLAPYFHALHASEKAQQVARARAEAQAREEGLRQGALDLTQELERERQRIGMDLHDQTLADLTRLLRDLTTETTTPDRQVLAERLGHCIDDLRRIIDTAVPTLLELFGFAHAVRVHLERATGHAPVVVDVDDRTDNTPDRLDTTTRTALFRITQEAINNTARHSGATRIDVLIDRDPAGRLRLTVQDNGCGFSATTAGRQSGLSHMRTRARLIDADLEILENAGTCVVVTLRTTGKEGRT